VVLRSREIVHTSSWVDFYGKIDGQAVGIAFLNHPASFGYPTRWHMCDAPCGRMRTMDENPNRAPSSYGQREADRRAMSFSFHFTSTHEDLLDAFAAQQRSRSGMRPWVRACVVGLGFLWLAGAIAFAPDVFGKRLVWLPIVWFLMGSVIVWKFLLQPILIRHRVRTLTPPAQPLVLNFTDSGIHIEAEGVGAFDLDWAEVTGIESAESGVAMGFTDGMVHWLPKRVFRETDEQQAFISYVVSRLLKEEEEVADVP
jgi:hypothetical protein